MSEYRRPRPNASTATPDSHAALLVNHPNRYHTPLHHEPPPYRPSSSSQPLILDATSPPYAAVRTPQPRDTSSNSSEPTTQPQTALDFCKHAPRAGYLHKRGRHIPNFKRRFFVLKPATHLYYFLNVSDDSPRGCLDLEGARVSIQNRNQLIISWENDDPCEQPPVVLEARSPQDALEWKEALETKTLDHSESQVKRLQKQLGAARCRISDLETQVDSFKHIEADRDGALEDAKSNQQSFQRLDETLRQLTQHIRRSSDAEGKGTTLEEEENDDADMEPTTIDPETVPGRYFGALHNSILQLQENLKLAVQEASQSVADVIAANEKTQSLEQRMGKAEKQLCKIWEENCELRKLVKHTKREKRVLVREVKNLRQHRHVVREEAAADDASTEHDEDKLIEDLELHIQSSIQLHEQFLAENGQQLKDLGGQPSIDLDTSNCTEDLEQMLDLAIQSASQPILHPDVPLFDKRRELPVASLFDDSGESDSESSTTSRTSIQAQHSQCEEEDSPERPNPLLQLDDSHEDEEPPLLIATSSQSESSRSMKQATAQIACPLADVVGPKNGSSAKVDEHQVYHLTFYSKKIGIQFQKVPPPPAKVKGLLTEAMTSDIARVATSDERTAAELRRIAHISTRAKSSELESVCDVAVPVDAVLVCGFHGFDDSGSNVRPKLGARLVAFDGVSIEVGKWSFDAVRKAIKARDRPLTLSFRNDYLTTEQRRILTKAVKEVDEAMPPPHPTIEYHTKHRSDPSVHSVLSHESALCPNDPQSEDDFSVSMSGSEYYHRVAPQSFSGSRSNCSAPSYYRSLSGPRSTGSGGNYHSEAGSSVLSAVAPIVSNLLGGRKGPFTPEYMSRDRVTVEETPQHQDFQSELL